MEQQRNRRSSFDSENDYRDRNSGSERRRDYDRQGNFYDDDDNEMRRQGGDYRQARSGQNWEDQQSRNYGNRYEDYGGGSMRNMDENFQENYRNYGSYGRQSGSRGEDPGYGRNYGERGSSYGSGGSSYSGGSWRENQGEGWGSQGEGNWRNQAQGYGARKGNNGGNDFGRESSWFGNTGMQSSGGMTGERTGGFRGKGPKAYKRSDERIKEDISDKLSDDDYVDASEIEVNVQNCEVTLTGTVDSKEAKRRVEDIAEAVSGVSNVQNQLRVSRSSSREDEQKGSWGSSSRMGSSQSGTNMGKEEKFSAK